MNSNINGLKDISEKLNELENKIYNYKKSINENIIINKHLYKEDEVNESIDNIENMKKDINSIKSIEVLEQE